MTPRALAALERRIQAEREPLLDAAARRMDGGTGAGPCAVEGCAGRAESLGLFAKHYAQARPRTGRSHRRMEEAT
jgi:hypothetical protein